MEGKKQKTIEIKEPVIRGMLTPAIKNTIKIESIIRDHYMNGVTLWEQDMITLLELIVSSKVLSSYLEELIEEMREAEVDSVHLTIQETQVLAALVKSLGLSYDTNVGNISLREH
jgi:hypothetical protein